MKKKEKREKQRGFNVRKVKEKNSKKRAKKGVFNIEGRTKKYKL